MEQISLQIVLVKMSEVLTQSEIRDLTLYKHKGKQIETLLKMGISFYTHPEKGKSIVTTVAVNQYKQCNDPEEKPN